MARARNIKPGFFTNDVLGELPALARLLFAGLWTHCDREGRCEDRPKKIKAQLLPYDDCDCDALLQMLHDAKFIERYTVGEISVIRILEWAKHQNPHMKEAASTLPAPDKHGASSVQAQDGQQPEPERAGLIPSSLIPDSLFSSSNELDPARPSAESAAPLALVTKPKGVPDCPHGDVLALWAEVLPAMPQHLASQWKGTRADHLRARWRETAVEKGWASQGDGLAYLRKLFGYVAQSAFLTGRAKPRGEGRPFVIELEWLVNPTNWAKVIEGKYHQEAA